jgi:two-component system phosphate regulon response regulator PhoB
MSKTILIVEDEPDLLAGLEYNLKREGYATRCAQRGADALRLARDLPKPDLVLLDLMLPDMSGKDVCRQLKASDKTASIPIMIVTARGEEVDRIVGFELGADDYVTKPFSIRELILRIQVVLRRAGPSQSGAASHETRDFGLLHIDLDAHRVSVAGEHIPLTALEFRLLNTFLERRGRAQSRSSLLEDVWGMHGDSNTRTVDTHVKRLRQKLGGAGQYIETLHGVGYRFADRPPDPEPS